MKCPALPAERSARWSLGSSSRTEDPPPNWLAVNVVMSAQNDVNCGPVGCRWPRVFAKFRDYDCIGNSRNRADEDVLRLIASMADFEPKVRHQADSLELVEDLIVAGMGIGLLPADTQPPKGIVLIPLTQPDVRVRAYARTRRGNSTWPALAAVLHHIKGKTAAMGMAFE
ncbi:LysR substrate-binding domain-containing protein [Arthrobacter sp. ISL-30]|uniref:LysR substrate-binding domain-containing protein n=1 Tax=Arthrobacter sp. ISL-30 TaxID=2819109 RepID=UPI001BE6AF1B|nr:LysR substrate-binding domain-containing protein [Arthrobacter sp. ISL-30]MBT2515338.1 hypothetical protein [Arthrobacter sp. ISL-30]